MCLNLGDVNVAFTQNFVSREGLPHALRFLRDRPQAISGVPAEDAPTLLARFRDALAAAEPAELARADAALDAERPRPGKWARAVADADGERPFSLAASWAV